MRADAAATIRAAREELGWSQLRLGRKAFGLDGQAAYNAVSRLERGDPSVSTVRYMDAAGVLGLAVMDVLEQVPEPPDEDE